MFYSISSYQHNSLNIQRRRPIAEGQIINIFIIYSSLFTRRSYDNNKMKSASLNKYKVIIDIGETEEKLLRLIFLF